MFRSHNLKLLNAMEPRTYSIEELGCRRFDRQDKNFDMHCYQDFIQRSKIGERPHRHNYYMLLLPTAGRGRQLIDFERYPIETGRLFLMYPGQVHAWEKDAQLKGYLIFFTTEFFSLDYHPVYLNEFPFFKPGNRQPFVEVDLQGHPRLLPLFKLMYNEYSEAGTDSFFLLRFYLNIILTECRRLFENQQPATPVAMNNIQQLVNRFEALIEQHYREKHFVRDYAKMMCITPNYLNTVISHATGKSAGELIRERIMMEAKRLLLYQKGTVAEVGSALHFDDNSYFCRFFKKYEGVSPETFRKEYGL